MVRPLNFMRNVIKNILIMILIATAAYFIYLAYVEHQPFEEAKIKQEALIDTATEDPDAAEDPINRTIDFDALQRINPDIIGWLYAPQIGVDAPILHGESYLNRSFDGSYSSLGSIFTFDYTSEDLTDQHLCLFAHNMMSGQMFGLLSRFKDSDFAQTNDTMYLYTPQRTEELKVCDVYEAYKTDEIFQEDWTDGTDSRYVTLATCSGYNRTPYRLVVNTKVSREKIIIT